MSQRVMVVADENGNYAGNFTTSAVAVTPNDSTVLSPTQGLYIGVTGNLTITMAGSGTDVVFSNVPVGFHPLAVTKVKATGTTATNIVACYG